MVVLYMVWAAEYFNVVIQVVLGKAKTFPTVILDQLTPHSESVHTSCSSAA